MSTLKILSDINCTVRCDFKEVGNIQAGELYELQLKKGCYILEFLVEDIVICSMDYTIETNDEEPLLRLNIKEQAEKKIMEQKFIRNKSTNVNIYLDDNNRYILDCEANNPIVIPKGYDLYYKSIDGQYLEDEAGYLPFRITIVEERIENGETDRSEKTLYGSLNKLGEIVIKPIYNTPVIFYNGEIARTARNKCLIHVNHYGEEIALSYLNTDCFDIIAPLDKKDNLFIAKSTEDTSCLGVVRYDKKIIVSLSNKTIYKNTGDYIWALKGDTLSIYNNEGKWVKSIRYVDLGEIELPYRIKHQDYVFVHKDAVAVRVSGYWGLYGFNGDPIIPHIYELIDAYFVGIDFCDGEEYMAPYPGYHCGNSPLMFVRKKGHGYGIINMNVLNKNYGIQDKNNIEEVLPCKYDAIYFNNGKKIEELNVKFFQREEVDDNGDHYDDGIGNDIFFVKYHNNLMECDYFCKDMLDLSGDKSKYKEEHFVCKEFNQYYYVDKEGKYHLRKRYEDDTIYNKINIIKASFKDYEWAEKWDVLEAIQRNRHTIIIDGETLNDFLGGWGLPSLNSTIRCDINLDYDDIIKICVESPESIFVKMKKNNKEYNYHGRIIWLNKYDVAFICDDKNIYRFTQKKESEDHNNGVKYLFFDTETTGVPLNYKAPSSDTQNWPRLVQLAWILTDEDGNRIQMSNLIVKPDGFTIPTDAAKVHGITTEVAMKEGIPLGEAIDLFIKDLNTARYIVGHNVDFDKKIVGAEMIRLGMKDILDSKKSYCTMLSSIDFCKIPGKYGYKYPKLQVLYKKLFGTEFDNAHDAMSDIEATDKCFWELRKRKLI